MDQSFYVKFLSYLDKEQKDQVIHYALNLLDEKKITLEELYLKLLTPALQNFQCQSDDADLCVWKEHTRTSIIRTLLEATYPYIIERKKSVASKKKTIMVVCPSEEYHEIGAIIYTHLFSLKGYSARYIGANTPRKDILSAIEAMKPDYVAISVTNSYNLVITKTITEEIRTKYPEVRIIVGGRAFLHEDALKQISYDFHIQSIDQIELMGGEER